MLKTLESGGGLEQLMAAHQAVAAFHGNNYLPLLEAFYRSTGRCCSRWSTSSDGILER